MKRNQIFSSTQCQIAVSLGFVLLLHNESNCLSYSYTVKKKKSQEKNEHPFQIALWWRVPFPSEDYTLWASGLTFFFNGPF